jgi:hypothetical protein
MFAEGIRTATIYAHQLRGGLLANGRRYDPSNHGSDE